VLGGGISMISTTDYIRQSLELNLFFARIMKEHLLFLSSAFVPNNISLVQQANHLQHKASHLLAETVSLSNGNISPDVLASGEIVTQYTLNTELATQFFTGIPIDTDITKAETNLMGSPYGITTSVMQQRVFNLNQKAIAITTAVAQFKENLLANVLSCNLFTHNYPLLIDHILREAKFYLKMLCKLQRYDEIDISRDILEQEIFWNRIMAEHSKFIRGFLDPTEEELFDIANNFAKEFDQLTKEAIEASIMAYPEEIAEVTVESLASTKELRDFKAQGTEGILNCNIKSIILPLLGDHVLREANHYLRLLKMFKAHM